MLDPIFKHEYEIFTVELPCSSGKNSSSCHVLTFVDSKQIKLLGRYIIEAFYALAHWIVHMS